MTAEKGDYIRILSHMHGNYGTIQRVCEIIDGYPIYRDTTLSQKYVAQKYEILKTFVNPKSFAKKGDKVILKNLCDEKDRARRGLKENVIYKVCKSYDNGYILLNSGDRIRHWQYEVVTKYKRKKS